MEAKALDDETRRLYREVFELCMDIVKQNDAFQRWLNDSWYAPTSTSHSGISSLLNKSAAAVMKKTYRDALLRRQKG